MSNFTGPCLYLVEKSDDLEITDLSFLTESDINYLEAVSSEARKKEYIDSRFIVYKILKDELGVNPCNFKKQSTGQPYLEGHDYSISLSHSKHWCALLVTKGSQQIGVDVEVKTALKSFHRIAEKYFNPAEILWISTAASKEEQAFKFRQLWSLKEAYFKSYGSSSLEEMLKLKFNLPEGCYESDQAKGCFYNLESEDCSLSAYLEHKAEHIAIKHYGLSSGFILTPDLTKNININIICSKEKK